MKKITWFGVARSPYNDYLLSKVHDSFRLQVYYKHKSITSHPWELVPPKYRYDPIEDNFFNALKNARQSDIIVMSGWSFWQHLLLMFFLPKRSKKVYWTDTPDMRDQCWSGVKGFVRKMIVNFVFKTFDEVWSTGKPGCDALILLGCNPAKVKSFPFFLDLTRFDKIDEGKRRNAENFKSVRSAGTNPVVFLCIGQLANKKKFDVAIEAISLLEPDTAVLWIAGSGPELSRLQKLATSFGVNRSVVFLGWLAQDAVELAYISADVFVHPSEFDPFPTVVLDAMSWGKPVIGTQDAGSVADRVDHGFNGFVYDSQHVRDLAQHMDFFIKHRDQIKQFGAEARSTASRFPVELGIAQLQAL